MKNNPKNEMAIYNLSLCKFRVKNHQEAFNRWKMMSGESGTLHTGHCLIYSKTIRSNPSTLPFDEMIKGVVSTKINFTKLTNSEISNYVKTNEPMNCAGGFALEGKGALFIDSIEGCYSNVIGISLPWLKTAFFEAKI